MIVVADTTPLNYLIRLGYDHILRDIYGRVLVPEAVITELKHPAAPAVVSSWIGHPPEWLEAVSIHQVAEGLAVNLGAGEREAITLALEKNADVLLIDDICAQRSRSSLSSSNWDTCRTSTGLAARVFRLPGGSPTTTDLWLQSWYVDGANDD